MQSADVQKDVMGQVTILGSPVPKSCMRETWGWAACCALVCVRVSVCVCVNDVCVHVCVCLSVRVRVRMRAHARPFIRPSVGTKTFQKQIPRNTYKPIGFD